MKIAQKAIFSFLLSALLVGGIAVLTLAGIFDLGFSGYVKTLLLVTVFLTVFLIIFFIINIRKDSPAKKQEHIDSIDAAPLTSNNDVGLLEEAADNYSPLADEENAAELEEIVYKNSIGELKNQNVAVFFIKQPFALPSDNPELLPEVESDLQKPATEALSRKFIDRGSSPGIRSEVIVEQGGIHYVNSDAVNNSAVEKMDNDFVKLVESVVGED